MSSASPIPQSVHRLYGEHHGWLHHWLQRKLGNTWDAADLAHDTFVRLMSGKRASANWGAEPRAFLTHIAKGLVIDHWRRQQVERAYLETLAHLPPAVQPCEETRLMVLQALYRVEAMLRGLPSRTREIFLLAQLDGLSYAAIAQRQRVSLPTVKRHMHAAYAACLALD